VNEEKVDAYRESAYLAVGPNLQTPFGFWRNETSVFINTVTMNYLEGTNFNYSCQPIFTPYRPGQDFKFADPFTTSPMPSLTDCKVQVSIPTKVMNIVSKYCISVNAVRNTDTGIIGLISEAADCQVMVTDMENITYDIWLSQGSYRFMKEINQIACIPTSTGFYVSCSNDPNLLSPIDPKDQGLDIPTEVVIETSMSDAYGATGGFNFGDLFNGNVNNLIVIIIWVAVGIAILAMILIIGCCVWKYCKRH
jgi:hypothetical protein